MEEQNNLLEQYTDVEFEYATPAQRFFNYLLDIVAFYILSAFIGVMAAIIMVAGKLQARDQAGGATQLLFLFSYIAIIILYYTVFEGSKGKTLGKLITKTRVLTEDFEPITYKQAFLRTLCRFVPFEALSAFFGLTMWHDKWTRTIVVKDKKVF